MHWYKMQSLKRQEEHDNSFSKHKNRFSFNAVSTKVIIKVVSTIPASKAGGFESTCVRSLKPVIETPSTAKLINVSLATAEVPVL